MAETTETVNVPVEETTPVETPAEEKKEEVVETPVEQPKEEEKKEETPVETPAEEKKEEEPKPVEEEKKEEAPVEQPKEEEEKKEEAPVEEKKEEEKKVEEDGAIEEVKEEKKEEEHLVEEAKEEEKKEEKKEEPKPEQPLKIKMIIVGESSVGKTSCMTRYVDGKFDEQTKATIGVGVGKKEVEVKEKKALLQIWDTAGQERFATLSTGYFRNAHGALVMFDVTNKDSFDNINSWIEQCVKPEEKRVICIVGNKIDVEERIVSKEDAEKKAEELKLKYFEVSAKTGEGFEPLFEYVLGEIIDQDLVKPEEEGVDIATTEQPKKKGGCC